MTSFTRNELSSGVPVVDAVPSATRAVATIVATPVAKRSAGAGRAYRRGMKIVRRVHLYSGLALVPFVVLYGVTAFLFNHPEAWSSTERRIVDAHDLAAAGRKDFGDARTLSAGVLSELGDPDWSIDDTVEPVLRGRSFLTTNANEQRYTFVVDDPDGDARVFVRPATPERTEPDRLERGDGEPFSIGSEASHSLQVAASSIFGLASTGESAPSWRVRSSPRLEFGVVRGGQAYRASYRLDERRLEVVPNTEPESRRGMRSFLLRLHTAHGYPTGFGAGFWWAVIVDIMAVAMVAWAATGVLMWWQMKNLRIAGVIALAICAVATAVLTLGQWDRLA